MSAIIGVDVGGTFTDLFLFDPTTGAFRTAKVPSQRGDEAVGFLQGLSALGDVAGFGAIVHGTTVGTNALLERKGCRLGVITTQGFRDVLEMRRRDRPRAWGLWGSFTPIAERALRVEVPERTLADGTIQTPVDLDAVRAAASALLAEGAQAVALVFINSYANPANERAAAAALRALWPNAHVSVSSEILPEIREFERASTTALNAYLQPKVADYLERLEGALASRRFTGRFHIVQSNGGIMSTARARATPARTALSGPAAGVIAAAAIARAAGFPNVITGDLGGTSFDVSLVVEGEMALAAQTTVDFGLVIRSPMIEITTIGAGGGSIARVDAGGLLQVGPESAGSRPGPVCYGQGNTRPTLTDANLVLGRINAARPIGGALARLDSAAAEAAILEHVGRPLGLDAASAAEAIIRVANARMAGAIRLVSIERGHDPGEFALLPFGGGGALHVGALLREVGLRAALVPRFPGITSALGCVLADVRHDATRTLNLDLAGLNAAALSRHLVETAAATRAVVEDAGLPLTGIESVFELDMHYLGQTHTVAVPLPGAEVTEEIIRTAFDAAYSRAFSRLLPGIGVRILSSRVTAIGRRPAFDMAALAPPATSRTTPLEARQVRFDGAWWTTPVFARLELPAGHVVQGPALLEQPDTTILVEPGLAARTDTLGNLILERT
ncbi:hydantoinase/oxoprolinase family protein [Roseococcus sp. SDR]|uniref:hydantoinase/oxoprolinase family protein n=1 Tax=Roseococcus sp. SDR TaxID=2835532 RepID=UPI001BCE0D27|nr:hydantoinase/oxoprolinase family protein [Roseococcus sp. SDR]MBS7789460.1 hydantoinase/oxoprolinase family protein [Roseococcus sp. SDR]MBV1844774.1 hydantoinase/oxoprolinase family protein [Roseococcus sp. SDR]